MINKAIEVYHIDVSKISDTIIGYSGEDKEHLWCIGFNYNGVTFMGTLFYEKKDFAEGLNPDAITDYLEDKLRGFLEFLETDQEPKNTTTTNFRL
jgi:hypothetical protein